MNAPYVDLAAHHAGSREALHAALDRVLAHGQLILGPEVAELEERLAELLGVPHVVSVGSGTDALMLALALHGVGPGDEVITVAHSFIATANAVVLCGATPVFVDIDDDTMCMDADAARAAITPRTRALLPVHLNGYPVDMAPFRALADEHRLALVEDAAQALGSRRDGRFAGTTGTGCFSLHPLKVLSALGDAGFVTLHSADDAERLRRRRNHGLKDRDHAAEVGRPSRLDTLQAAFLLAELQHLDGWLAARRAHAAAYRSGLAHLPVRLPPPDPPGGACNASAFVIRHPRRDALAGRLRDAGVDAKIHYPVAIHQQPPFRDAAPRLPVTERVVGEILSLPVAAELSAEGRRLVLDAVTRAAREV